ncbi:hypothetical protein G3I64_33425 [Streptomyces sp. SID8499]|nr:hypothetical protein [Streptomyces sennicomposti]MYS40610.1 hypothetical protein [Streptomyces sp. SID5998]MYX42701.1 hypothetical protein [Streptomyces sp. SID89]NED37363.1 hypothetical protein [Streptomyces sp. SID8499]NED77400.1 hypothetical protein [Streptomyces sp. SID9944]
MSTGAYCRGVPRAARLSFPKATTEGTPAMDPRTYARLYGPHVPVRRTARPAVVVLAVVLWTLTLLPLAGLTAYIVLVTAWGAAEGEAVGGFLLWYFLPLAIAAGVLTALAFVPPVRRMAWDSRLLLLGAAAGPVLMVFTAGLWVLAV